MKLLIPILLFTLFLGTETSWGQFQMASSMNNAYGVFEKVDKQLDILCGIVGIERKRHVKTMHCDPTSPILPHEKLFVHNLDVVLGDIIDILTAMAEKQHAKDLATACSICGKQITIDENGTYIQDYKGHPVPLHQRCLNEYREATKALNEENAK